MKNSRDYDLKSKLSKSVVSISFHYNKGILEEGEISASAQELATISLNLKGFNSKFYTILDKFKPQFYLFEKNKG